MIKTITSLLLIAMSSIAFSAASISFATGEFPPYVSRDISDGGTVNRIVQAACIEAGIKASIAYYPWLRAESRVRSGQDFAAYPYAWDHERASEFLYSDSLMQTKSRFFYLKSKFKSKPNFKTFPELREFTIGGTLGYWYVTKLSEESLKTDLSPNEQDAFKKLANGRVDFVPADEINGWHIIHQLFPGREKKFAMLDAPIRIGTLHLIVSWKYPDSLNLLSKFNQGLAAIKANGTYQAIVGSKQLDNDSRVDVFIKQ